LEVPTGISAAEAEEQALAAVRSKLETEPVRVIVREPKLVNFVTKA
jgi:hypothetical protein